MAQATTGYLAVAIGTSHGAYKGKGRPLIDFPRLERIPGLVEAPLVLHGASSVPPELIQRFRAARGEIGEAAGIHPEDIRKAIAMGIAKINTDADLRLAFTALIREGFQKNPKEFDPRKYLGPAREAVKEGVKSRMELFGSAGKA
ncbi:class II fructose-bisphosphate aldolase [Thermus tengchongensis]|uniref:class II fructose-bisphosphate aldolase n=1 Tax=Thermus tengchongensis TaxID=1214928 RepID=UPI001F0DC106|nr:class II fructose-bisphosphate aldolase [Thermus tengchongensis]